MSGFFISYSRKDSAYANKIRNHISRLDSTHDVFLDITSIKVGANWKAELQRKIYACDFFIFIHSAESLKSKLVSQELAWVAESELKTGMRKMIVYRINFAEIIPAIANYQVLDASDNFTIDFYKLMQGVYAGNSFYDVMYEIKLMDEYWYEGKIWIDAPLEFLKKIQMVEYRLDYGWDDKHRIQTVKSGTLSLKNKFRITFHTKYHFTLFAMLYLWNTRELPFIKKILISH